MKQKMIFGFLFAAIIIVLTSCASSHKMARIPAEVPGYCMAIRGNGELAPAHWGAMARTVEQLGLPQAMAGGSSATTSMFFLEAMASHPAVKSQPVEIQKLRVSLMLKSLVAYFAELQKTEFWKNSEKLFGQYKNLKEADTFSEVIKAVKLKDWKKANDIIDQAKNLGLLSEPSIQLVKKALKTQNPAHAIFYTQELKQSAMVLGQFNAVTDDNLFFRAGLIDFDRAAESLGRVADFYANIGSTKVQNDLWGQFFQFCTLNSEKKQWADIVKSNPNCSTIFSSLFKEHIKFPYPSETVKQYIGKTIAVFPTTTVLVGSAAAEYLQALDQYHQKMDSHFGKDFKLSNPDDVRFGYWGNKNELEQIATRLNSSDEKNRRFLALGEATWKEVLSLSPAEPGLSPLKPFKTGSYISAGGWSDLHPVGILKAAGCKEVVYLTRQGGESLFAQGVAKRLLGLDRDWKKLSTTGPSAESTKNLNNKGDKTDMTSLWSRLYNLANPSSSINLSLKEASAVLCTNWNNYSMPKDLTTLVSDSFQSSYWMNPQTGNNYVSLLRPVLAEQRPGCKPVD